MKITNQKKSTLFMLAAVLHFATATSQFADGKMLLGAVFSAAAVCMLTASSQYSAKGSGQKAGENAAGEGVSDDGASSGSSGHGNTTPDP